MAANRDLFPALERAGWRVAAVAPSARQTGVAGNGLWEPSEENNCPHCRTAPVMAWGHPLLYTYRRFEKLMSQLSFPEVVLAIEEPYLPATAQILRWCQNKRVPMYFYTAQSLPRRHPWPIRKLEQWVLAHAAGAWCVNEAARERILQLGFIGPAEVIGLGIDPARFQPAEPRTSNDAPTALYVGRLAQEKGLIDLLSAVERVPGLQLRIVGNGPQELKIRQMLKQSPAGARIVLEPAWPSLRIPMLMAQVDFLVLPSRTTLRWKEQFGRVLVEAMACQVPVIGSDSGEIPMVIGPAGLVFPEGQVEALAQAMAYLAQDHRLRLELGKRGRMRVLEHFTWETVARALTKLIRRA